MAFMFDYRMRVEAPNYWIMDTSVCLRRALYATDLLVFNGGREAWLWVYARQGAITRKIIGFHAPVRGLFPLK